VKNTFARSHTEHRWRCSYTISLTQKPSTLYSGKGSSRLLDRAGRQDSLGAGTHHCTIHWMDAHYYSVVDEPQQS